MPQGSLRIKSALSNVAVQYKNENYIAADVMGEIPVNKDAGYYWIYANDFRIEETKRGNKALANMATWAASTSTYTVQKHALKDALSEEDRMNSDLPGSLDVDTTEYLTDKIMLRYEYEVHKLLFTTTSFSNNTTLTSATSWRYNTTTSAPIQNVLSATSVIQKFSGKRPNMAVMGWDVFAALKENANIYGRIQYVERAMVTKDLLAALFDLNAVHVGAAAYMNAGEGLETTTSQSYIWGADCLIAYMDGVPGIKKQSAAVTFRVNEFGKPYRVKKWFSQDYDCDFIEVETKFGPRAVATSCAYLFKTAAL
jgi:hypothetical protein